jgi:flagellar hook-length control protein FliK
MISTDLAPAGPRPAPTARGEPASRTEGRGGEDAFARLLDTEGPAADATVASPAAEQSTTPETATVPPRPAGVEVVLNGPAPDGLDAEIADPVAAAKAGQAAPVAEPAPSPEIAAGVRQTQAPALPADTPPDSPQETQPDVDTGRMDIGAAPDGRAGANAAGTPAAAVQSATPAPVPPPTRAAASTAPIASAPGEVRREDAEAEAAPADADMLPPRAAQATPAAAAPLSVATAPQPLAMQDGTPIVSVSGGWRLDEAHGGARPTPAPHPAAATTASAREVAGQITLAVAQATQPQVEVRLDPPELGRVSIRLNPVEGGLQALVIAERPETQEFLRRHAEVLLRDLDAAGYDSVSLDFASGHGTDPRDAPAERAFQTAGAWSEPTAPVVAGPAVPRTGVAGGLDIRL